MSTMSLLLVSDYGLGVATSWHKSYCYHFSSDVGLSSLRNKPREFRGKRLNHTRRVAQ
jgi:hypothetical protein